jgi:electron transfer flavoprotein beta subunit
MNIVVCVKQVPDTWAERKLKPDGTLDRASVDGPQGAVDGRGQGGAPAG